MPDSPCEIQNKIIERLLVCIQNKELFLSDIKDFISFFCKLTNVDKILIIIKEKNIVARTLEYRIQSDTFDYLETDFFSEDKIKQIWLEKDDRLEISQKFMDSSDYVLVKANKGDSKYIELIQVTDNTHPVVNSDSPLLQIALKSIIDKSINTKYASVNTSQDEIGLNYIIDGIDQIIIVSDIENKSILFANKFAKKVFNRPLVGESCHMVMNDSAHECKNCSYRPSGEYNVKKDIYHKSLDKYFTISYQCLELNDGRKVKIEAAFDITEIKARESEISARFEMVELIQKALDKSAIVNIRDSDGRVVFCNDKYVETFGYSREELQNNITQDKRIQDEYFDEIISFMRKGKTWKGEIKAYTKSGDIIWLDSTVIPFIKSDGVQIVTISQDVSDKKLKDERIRKLARAVEFSPVSIVVTDKEGCIEFVNPKFTEATGYSYSESIGNNPRILKSGYMSQIEYQALWRKISSGNTWTGFFHNKRKNGELFWESASISPILDDLGNITHYVAVKEDVTFKKKIEEALANSLALIQTSLESINEGIIAFNKEGSYTTINSNFLKLWDINEVEFVNKSEYEIFALISSKIVNGAMYYDNLRLLLSDNEATLFEQIELINGFIFEFTIKPLRQNDEIVGRLCSFRDVTEKHRNNEQLMFYTQNLESAKKRLEFQTDKLEHTVLELESAKEKAESATKAKSEFIANISHEIRTPLNAVIGFAELMKEEDTTPKQLDYLESIFSSGKNLLRLINDILDLSKIDAGKLEIQFESISIIPLFKEVCNIFKMAAATKNLDFRIRIDKDMPSHVFIDEVRLRQILFNIIGNAVKFTETGFIEARFIPYFEYKDSKLFDLKIEIQDTGIGVSDELKEIIFDSFTQQSGQNARKFGGTGLGLAITKKLTEMIGGSVKVESLIGEGSTFIVELNKLKIAKTEIVNQKDDVTTIQEYEFEPVLALAADDMPVNVKLIEDRLKIYGIRTISAKNGLEAVERAIAHRPEIIFMDFKMPELSGEEAAKRIKSIPELQNCKIIALSAASFSNEEKERFKSVFDDYLNKPFTADELIKILKKYLKYKTKETRLDLEFPEDNSSLINAEESEICNSKDILYLLENELFQKWEEARKLSIIDGIKSFAIELKDLALQNSLPTLEKYADKLFSEASNFDFERFPITLDLYPKIVESYKK
jgi:PAS domain S-box-containing protein